MYYKLCIIKYYVYTLYCTVVHLLFVHAPKSSIWREFTFQEVKENQRVFHREINKTFYACILLERNFGLVNKKAICFYLSQVWAEPELLLNQCLAQCTYTLYSL